MNPSIRDTLQRQVNVRPNLKLAKARDWDAQHRQSKQASLMIVVAIVLLIMGAGVAAVVWELVF